MQDSIFVCEVAISTALKRMSHAMSDEFPPTFETFAPDHEATSLSPQLLDEIAVSGLPWCRANAPM